MSLKSQPFYNPDQFCPEFRDLCLKEGIVFNKDTVAIAMLPVVDPHQRPFAVPIQSDRCEVAVKVLDKVMVWRASSLRALFRGDAQPPHLGDQPQAYQEGFALFDAHLADYSVTAGCPRDAELEQVFAALRKRLDGRSLGCLHDQFWRVSSLLLATRPLSQAEFEAIMARLERSARTFGQGSTSSNMASTISQLLKSRKPSSDNFRQAGGL